ncbi:MAG TPA: MMPL family transporter, partial [Solirubrobacteraceae bacterium]|nr:MMPL family transporter [Solirubrobacteraceae bacterium]
PVLTLAVVLLAALAGGLLALGLQPNAGSDTFVSRSSESFRASDDFHRHFGDDAVVILIRESLPNLVETKDLATLTQLEACLAGQVVIPSQQAQAFEPAPTGALPAYGGARSPCGKLMRFKPVQAVYGPGTFLNRAVTAVNSEVQAMLASLRQSVASAQAAALQLAVAKHLSHAQALAAANAAGQLAQQQGIQQFERMALDSGIAGTPRIDDPQFIPQIVFDQTRGVNQPKARFAYLFPTANSSLIQVRLKPDLSDQQRANAIAWIRRAVRMPIFASAYGGRYTVTGAPVVVNDLASEITASISGLLVAAVLVMAVVLLLVFRNRLRLLPLAIALAATGITFGVTSLAGASLTMASVAVLPILIGLAVDYAIQFQSRVQEARSGDPEAPGLQRGAQQAVERAAAVGAPTIATAALATATGFLVLLLSPVPMVRGFGVLLVVGVAIALLCALTAGAAAMSLGGLGERHARPVRLPGATQLTAAWRGARELLRENALTRALTGAALVGSVRRPERVLCVGLALAALGWGLDTQTRVETDITRLVPQSLSSLQALSTLEQATGVGGEIDVMISGRSLTTPATIEWMSSYQSAVLRRFGYSASHGCGKARLCPAFSLPDLFAGQASSTAAHKLTQAQVSGLLDVIPPYFAQDVIAPDRRVATLAFGIRLMALDQQQQLIERMRANLHPPAGVTATLVGLPVLAAASGSQVADPWRRIETLLVGLLAVALVLLVAFRGDRRRALTPLVPIVLATGWSALILFAVRVPLNPMSVTLGALVIAISTEFSVLLSERHRQERLAGHDTVEALRRSYARTGAAVAASGVTAIAGFGVLALSDITMLRDFGLVTLIDLSVSLVGVLVALPAVIVIAEREQPLRSLGAWRASLPRTLRPRRSGHEPA